MSLWQDLETFLETRLEEFLQANPQLQLYVLLEKVRDEEQRTQQQLILLRQEERELQTKILTTAQEVKKWFERKQQAKISRPDLAQAAEQREAEFLAQGNHMWARKSELALEIKKNEKLFHELSPRRQELEAKIKQQVDTSTTSAPPQRPANDDLDARFRQWELDKEIEALKKKMGH